MKRACKELTAESHFSELGDMIDRYHTHYLLDLTRHSANRHHTIKSGIRAWGEYSPDRASIASDIHTRVISQATETISRKLLLTRVCTPLELT